MKKSIYTTLAIITLGLLSYTLFYTYSHTTVPVIVTIATSTEIVASSTAEDPHIKVLTTQTGKKITLTETNPVGESLSTITITSSGFATNTPIVIEKNKLTNSFLLDLNKDTFDELIIVTTAQGSGSYADATIYTTSQDKQLTPVITPEITEEITKKGGLFEGYTGHDTFMVVNGALVREFPTSTGTNTQSLPTGTKRKVIYSLNEKGGVYSITFMKETITSTTTVQSSTTQSLQ